MNVLERIDELRNSRGWSINYLAMEAMLTQSTLNNLYTRKAEPKLSTLRSICDAFGITLADFFAGMEQPKTESADFELKQRISSLTKEQKEALLTIVRSMQK